MADHRSCSGHLMHAELAGKLQRYNVQSCVFGFFFPLYSKKPDLNSTFSVTQEDAQLG